MNNSFVDSVNVHADLYHRYNAYTDVPADLALFFRTRFCRLITFIDRMLKCHMFQYSVVHSVGTHMSE